MKLTPAKKRAMQWYADNDGTRNRPEWLTKVTVTRLCEIGMLRRDHTIIGRPRVYVTAAGREALEKERGE